MGGGIFVDGQAFKSGQYIDFQRPVTLIIESELQKKSYNVIFHSYTGLPVVYIETRNRQPISSKEKYVSAAFELYEDAVTRAINNDTIWVNIKGRGNSTWDLQDKKPYRLKFEKKISILGEYEDKSWVLLANAFDKTMLRNQIAFYLSSTSNLEYTPKSHYVELFLNGGYNGTYQLVEKLKIAKHRVNVGDDGFLLEIDGKADKGDPVFFTDHLIFPVNIKEPEVVEGDSNFEYVKDYVCKADSILFSDDWQDEDKGWTRYFDITSFVDWYILNEICKSPDAQLHTSCFMNMSRGGKLKMGPVWDFDTGFGNYKDMDCSPYGFWAKNSTWYQRMFEDSYFLELVKHRFNYFYSMRNSLYSHIDEIAKYLALSAEENDRKWNLLYEYKVWNNDVWGAYYNEVQSLKEWIENRMNWLKIEFDRM